MRKIPEKLKDKDLYDLNAKQTQIAMIQDKINEIIDYLASLNKR